MTRNEIAEWFKEIYESGIGNDIDSCLECRFHYTQELIAHSTLERYQSACQLLRQGTVNYQPRYQKIQSFVNGMDQMDYILIGADLSIKEAFCSKNCFIDYIYNHQAELVELITA